jgi:CheY-like chemotaxis protein
MNGTLDGTAVLVVDDDADSVELLGFVVSHAGGIVRTATSGPEALEILSGWTPSVLLLDVAMPRMDGCALLAAVRCQPALAAIPAVAITARASARDQARNLEAGFAVHVSKPFDVMALLDIVEGLAGEQRP